MLLDFQTINKISELFSSLENSPILADKNGNAIIPHEAVVPPFPDAEPAPGKTVCEKDVILYRLQNAEGYLILKDCAGGQDIMRMTAVWIEGLLKSGAGDAPDSCRRLLMNDFPPEERLALAESCCIPAEQERCVLLLEGSDIAGMTQIPDSIPVTEKDRLVFTEKNILALVKDLQGMNGQTEVEEYARALQETLQEETGQNVRIGIGTAGTTLGQLRESYQQAMEALTLGKRFRPEQSLFMFTSLLSERLLASLSPAECERCRGMLFNSHTAKLFTPEILKMLEIFFQKDLSISDTARTLFMHRNTLIYRLNKIQSKTGLDLRHFDDAACFQMLYKLEKK